MRRFLHSLGIFILSIFSIDTLFAFLDWWGRWDVFSSFMGSHPAIARLVRTPWASVALLVVGFASLMAERHLKLPRIVARIVNARHFPDLSMTPMRLVFDSEMKTPGWDEEKLDWEWFVELQIVNGSETPTTVDEVEVSVKRPPKNWLRQLASAEYLEEMSDFRIDMGLDSQANGRAFTGERYRTVPSLMEKIRNVPLTKGIGYRGWLRFRVNASQREMASGRLAMNIWLVDALQGRHRARYKRKSEQCWDKGFLIFKDRTNP